MVTNKKSITYILKFSIASTIDIYSNISSIAFRITLSLSSIFYHILLYNAFERFRVVSLILNTELWYLLLQ